MFSCSPGLHVNLPSNSLASYNEVTNAFPSDKKLQRIAGKKLEGEEWGEEYDKITGELFKHEFFRVVLDEGHAIRNYRTKSLLGLLLTCSCLELTSLHQPRKPASVCPANTGGS